MFFQEETAKIEAEKAEINKLSSIISTAFDSMSFNTEDKTNLEFNHASEEDVVHNDGFNEEVEKRKLKKARTI